MSPDEAAVIVCPNCGKKNRVRAVASGVPHCANCEKPLPWFVEAGEATFPATVERSPLPALVDFWAPWCGPCRMVEPVVEQMSRELAGKLKVVRVNSDEAPQLSQRFEIRGIPTLMLFAGGQLKDRITGAVDATTMRRWLNAALPAPR
jgi:thioredoxin 2